MTLSGTATPTSDLPASGRDTRLDALRGFAIILVVLGHALVRGADLVTPSTHGAVLLEGVGYARISLAVAALLNVIYSVHIPLLAFVSGLVLANPRTGFGRTFVVRRFWGLFVPYLSWLAVNWVIAGDRTLNGFVRFMAGGILSTQSAGTLWYLYALFTSTLIFAAVMTIGGSTRMLAASAVLVGLLGIAPLGAYERVLGLSDVAWLYPFVIAGVLVARYRETVEQSRWAFPATAVAWLASLPLVWQVLVPGDRWWYPVLAPAMTALGTVWVPVVLKALWAAIRLGGALAGVVAAYYAFAHVAGRVRTGLAWIGRRTLGIYATHGYFLLLPLACLGTAPRTLAYFVLALAGSITATLLLERTRMTRRFFLGIRRPL